MATRITQEMKDDLHAVFVKLEWGYNRQLGKGSKVEPQLQALIDKHSPILTKKKVAYQLKLWKNKTFRHADACLHGTPQEIRQQFESQLTMSTQEFAHSVILSMVPGSQENEERSQEEQEYLLQCVATVPNGEAQLQAIIGDASLLAVFTNVADNFVTIGCECFPKVASMTSLADTKFQSMRLTSLQQKFFTQFAGLAKRHALLQSLTDVSLRTLTSFIEECMFRFWALMGQEQRELPIQIPSEIGDINRHSLPVVYYTASWIIAGVAAAKKAAANDKERYSQFAIKHLITKEESLRLNLPTKVIDRKDPHNKQHRCSKEFFSFILRLEWTYVKNLTVDMMLSYSRGDLLNKIRKAVEQDESFRSEFRSLCPATHQTSAMQMLLRCALVKFVHMRGRWFEKAVHGAGKERNTVVKSMPTRQIVVVNSMIASSKSRLKKKEAEEEAMHVAKEPERTVTDSMHIAAQSNVCEAANDYGDDETDDICDAVDDVINRKRKGMDLDDD